MNNPRDEIPDGTVVQVDSEWGRLLGLTSDAFAPTGELAGQLFKRGNDMYLVAIEVLPTKRRQGCLNRLLKSLWDFGFTIKVPNPLPDMYRILQRKQFTEISEQSITSAEPEMDVVMVRGPER